MEGGSGEQWRKGGGCRARSNGRSGGGAVRACAANRRSLRLEFNGGAAGPGHGIGSKEEEGKPEVACGGVGQNVAGKVTMMCLAGWSSGQGLTATDSLARPWLANALLLQPDDRRPFFVRSGAGVRSGCGCDQM